MSTFTITINTDNDAFSDGLLESELTTCLEHVTDAVAHGQLDGRIRDTNGNTVGHFNHNEEE